MRLIASRIICLVALAVTMATVQAQRFVETSPTLVDLLAMNPANKNTVWFVRGTAAPLDGGEGLYFYDSTSSATPSSTIYAPTGPYTGRWFKASIGFPIDPSALGSGLVSLAEFDALNGLTGPIMPLFDSKLNTAGGTVTGQLTIDGRLVSSNVYIEVDELLLDSMIVQSIDVPYINTDSLSLGGVALSAWPISIGTAGDIVYHDSDSWESLSIGAEGTVLKVVSGVPTWGSDLVGESGAGGEVADSLTLGNPIGIINFAEPNSSNEVTAPLVFIHATNGISGSPLTAERWLFNLGDSNHALTFPSSWMTNMASTLPVAITNQTGIHLEFKRFGTVDSETTQTNVLVKEWTYFNFPTPVIPDPPDPPDPPATGLTDSLIAYWSMDESSLGYSPVTREDSVGTQDLTGTSTLRGLSGKIGKAAEFNEVSVSETEYLSHADSPELSVGGDISFTYAGWLRFTSTNTDMTILGQMSYSPGDDQDATHLSWFSTTSTLRFVVYNGVSGASAGITGALPLNTWMFVVAGYNADTDEISISINDGTPATATLAGGAADSPYAFAVGKASGTLPQYFRGWIDELAFYKRALSSENITALYNSGNGNAYPFSETPPPTPSESSILTGLRTYWAIDENNDGGTVNTPRLDSVGSETLTDNSPTTVQSVTGRIGRAGKFVSSNTQKLSRADDAGLQFGDANWSIALWVQLSSTNGGLHRGILSKWDSVTAGDREFQLRFDITANQFGVALSTDGTASALSLTCPAVTGPALNTWYHVVFYHSADDNLVGISVNGSAPTESAFTGPLMAGTDAFWIGGVQNSSNAGTYLDGLVDEVGIWDKVLTPTEIIELYNSGSGFAWPFASP